MNMIKKPALVLFAAITLAAGSAGALAEETVNATTNSVAQTIAHLEKALVEINKSDFSAATLHLKAARNASEQISGGDAATLKEANNNIVQGLIQSKHGDVQKSAAELNKALKLYKSL